MHLIKLILKNYPTYLIDLTDLLAQFQVKCCKVSKVINLIVLILVIKPVIHFLEVIVKVVNFSHLMKKRRKMSQMRKVNNMKVRMMKNKEKMKCWQVVRRMAKVMKIFQMKI